MSIKITIQKNTKITELPTSSQIKKTIRAALLQDFIDTELTKMGFTYAHYDHKLILRLDHIWTRGVEVIETVADFSNHHSDHYPITIRFKL